jgi:hypothetical protein
MMEDDWFILYYDKEVLYALTHVFSPVYTAILGLLLFCCPFYRLPENLQKHGIIEKFKFRWFLAHVEASYHIRRNLIFHRNI